MKKNINKIYLIKLHVKIIVFKVSNGNFVNDKSNFTFYLIIIIYSHLKFS